MQSMLSLREDISAREKTAAIKEIEKLDTMLKDCMDYEKYYSALPNKRSVLIWMMVQK